MNSVPFARCLCRFLCLSAVCLLALSPSPARCAHQNPENYDFIESEGWGGWDGVLTGRVIDEDGHPIPNADVKVHSKNISVKADQNGCFTIRGLQQGGRYSLIISSRGKEVGTARLVPIPRFQNADIGDFSLEREKIWTNFWVVSSNLISEANWQFSSNFYSVQESITTVYSYAQWAMRFSTNFYTPYTGMNTNQPPAAAQPVDSLPQGGS